MIDLEKIKQKLLKGYQHEDIIKKFNWKEFEGFIAEIFRNNHFFVKQNFVFKTKNRYEIDLVAVSNRYVLCIDCKEWNRGRYKKSGLKKAANKQEKRVGEFRKFLKKNLIANKMLNTSQKSRFYSLIVTLFEEELLKENNTIIVPAWKLNSFLLDLDNYLA
ncbi:MAG: NERD domain-containing protein [Candidatus Aenigmarchaeota archaeon]|nr:NERD domain-containing protein [Candidatus Aenigmarchaeota archaeon]